jgi:hypothetical protein
MFNSDISAENWLDPVELLFSVWLLASPFVLGFFDVSSASIVMIAIGSTVFLTAQLGLSNHLPWEEWINLLLAALLIASPWLFGFAGIMAATVNAVVSGIILAILALAALLIDYSYMNSQELAAESTHRRDVHARRADQ